MTPESWARTMASISDSARFFAGLDVVDLHFTSFHTLEVYVAVEETDRAQGLAGVTHLDLDLGGMFFAFPKPVVVPFSAAKMTMDMSIAWYDRAGKRLKVETVKAGDDTYLRCVDPFSYVLETPAGQLPPGDLVLVEPSSDSDPITMADGSYPISGLSSLKAAIHLVGRSKKYTTAQVKAHIIAAAKKLGLTSSLPDGWGG